MKQIRIKGATTQENIFITNPTKNLIISPPKTASKPLIS